MSKIRVEKLMIFFVWALMFSIPVLSQRVNNILLLLLEGIVWMWILSKRFDRKLMKKCTCVSIYAMYIIISTALSVGVSTRIMTAFVVGVKYLTFFYVSLLMAKRHKIDLYLKIITKLTMAIVGVSDIILFVSGGKGIGGDEVLGLFFVGNKFTLSYVHMFLMSLIYIQVAGRKKEKFFWFTVLTVYSGIVAVFSDCTTGFLGVVTIWGIVFLDYYRSQFSKFIESGAVFIVFMAVSTFFVVGSDILLSNPFVKELLMKYSHTSKILSGRVDMYNVCLEYIPKRLWLGHGINCTIVEDILTWGNPQNGLLKMLLDYGVIGTILFGYVVVKSFKNKRYIYYSAIRRCTVPFIALLYGLAVCSVVELSINSFFYFGLSVLFAVNANIHFVGGGEIVF